MSLLQRFLDNHVLANLTFGLVLVLGWLAYMDMPRARDPDINFNWIAITTVLPGAASLEVEKRITDPIEATISRTVKDLRFVSSTSRDNISSILVRFNQISKDEFRERIIDLRREVQNVYASQLPAEALNPQIIEITTSSGFPTAIVALTSLAQDDNFRRYSADLRLALERLPGIDSVNLQGAEKPELKIEFYPDRLLGLGINPTDLATTVQAYFRDISIGDINTESGRWLVRLEGTSSSLEQLESFPIVTAQGVVPLGGLADIYRASAEPSILAAFQGEPAIILNITKQDGANTLELLDTLRAYIEEQNQVKQSQGYQLHLVDDQTISTRDAINLMQRNAFIGLTLVMLVVFVFLGGHIALLTGIGIIFTLAGTFFVLHSLGISLNNSVLLGVVIALGMLVDDAVVVVETIYYRLQQGAKAMQASIEALKEVAAPVLTSVLTTISVFLPLMLLPGIMGEFMRVIPMVVCIALAISLLEAFWMLPAHVAALRVNFREESRLQRWRRNFTRRIRHNYSKLLVRVLRHPWLALLGVTISVVFAVALLASDLIRVNFFASDPYRVVYVSAELPTHRTVADSLEAAKQLEQKALAALEPGELRSSIIFSGQMFTQTEALFGENYSQVFISLNPIRDNMRDTYDLIDAVEQAVGVELGDASVSVMVVEDGPPLGQPINIKVRGDEFDDLQAAVDELVAFMKGNPLFKNINQDFRAGSPELTLALDGDAIQRARVSPTVVANTLQSYVDGMLIGQYYNVGEEVDIRLLAQRSQSDSLRHILDATVATTDGESVALSSLVREKYGVGQQNIRHYNFKRAITIAADIDEEQTDTVAANKIMADYWATIQPRYPNIELDFSGMLDDINESMGGLQMLFLIGVGLIYLILGTQFRSYSQPLLILVSVPLAFVGVIYGLAITGNPMSFSTMYGVVALSGIAVNSAIVLISAANARLAAGMSPLHATIYAGRRRVVPILITSSTTIAGLFSLAAGIGGKSLVWGPIATAIVSGLVFSTVLVLVVVPLLYYASVRSSHRKASPLPATTLMCS